jgi:hypothetical protein
MPMRINRLAAELQVPPTALLAWLADQGHGRYAREDQQLPDDLTRLARVRVRDIGAQARVTASSPPAPGAGGAAAPPATPPPPVPTIVEGADDAAMLAALFADVRPLSGRPPPPTRTLAVRPPAVRPPAPAPSPAPGRAPSTVAPARTEAPPPATGTPPRAAPTPAYVGTLEARVAELEDALARERAARSREAEVAARDAMSASAATDALTRRLAAAETRADALQATLDAAAADAQTARPVTLRTLLEARGLVGDDEIHLAFRALGDARLASEIAGVLRLAQPAELAEVLSLRLSLRARGESAPAHGACAVVEVPAERADAADIAPAVGRLSTACLVNGVRAIAWIGGAPHQHRALRERLDPRIRVHTFGPDRLPHASLDVDACFAWDPARARAVPGALSLSARSFPLAVDEAARALSERPAPGSP